MALHRRLALVPFLSLLAVGFAAGCSPAPRDFGAGGDGGGASSSSSSSSSASASSSGAGGQGGGLPTVCAPGLPPWAGPLCGPPGLPCKVITDEILPDPPKSRIGPPSIGLDASCSPQILFDNNIGKFNGFYAVRTGPKMWTVDPTPFEITSSGFEVLADGTPLVIGNDHAVWQKPKGGIWSSGAAFPIEYIGNADSFAREPSGALHLALYNYKDNNAYYGHLKAGTSTWAITLLGPMVSTRFPLALSSTGDPHVTYWNSMGAQGWFLSWIVPPGPAEIATPLGSNLLDFGAQQQKLAVTAPDGANPTGKPHVMFVRNVAGSTQLHELVTVERTMPGAWKVTVLETENAGAKFCTGMPAAGQMCNFDYEQLGTLGIVASPGGDLRFLYGKIHRMGTSVGKCDPIMPPFCYWSQQTDMSTGEIRIAWLDQGGKPVSAPVVSNVMPNTARVIVDTIGHFHVALLDTYPPLQMGTTIRYVEIGP